MGVGEGRQKGEDKVDNLCLLHLGNCLNRKKIHLADHTCVIHSMTVTNLNMASV